MMNKKTRKIVCKALRRAGWPTRYTGRWINEAVNQNQSRADRVRLLQTDGKIALVFTLRDIDYPNPTYRTVEIVPAVPTIVRQRIADFRSKAEWLLCTDIDSPDFYEEYTS